MECQIDESYFIFFKANLRSSLHLDLNALEDSPKSSISQVSVSHYLIPEIASFR